MACPGRDVTLFHIIIIIIKDELILINISELSELTMRSNQTENSRVVSKLDIKLKIANEDLKKLDETFPSEY